MQCVAVLRVCLYYNRPLGRSRAAAVARNVLSDRRPATGPGPRRVRLSRIGLPETRPRGPGRAGPLARPTGRVTGSPGQRRAPGVPSPADTRLS
eukprot:761446-Hanusia_phi.AAC.1